MVYCGIDIGTSNVKAIVLADDGGVLAVGAFSNSSLPAGGEQAKSYKGGDCWYRQFCRVMDYFHGQGVFEGQKVVCCVACQGGSFILIDDEMNTLGQISLWTSGSGQSQADKYLKHYSGEDFYRLTGWAPAGWMPIFKLKEMEFAEGEMVAFVSDYIYAIRTIALFEKSSAFGKLPPFTPTGLVFKIQFGLPGKFFIDGLHLTGIIPISGNDNPGMHG